jgi:hypothetical protein
VRDVVVLGVLLLAATAATAAGAARPAEPALLRQIKVEAFDGHWPEVLALADNYLARFPDAGSVPQVEFTRARALARLPGRAADSTAAFREFAARHPEETLLVEQSWSGIFSLACDAGRQESAGCAATLSEGLLSPLAYVSTLAAIRASDTRQEPLRRRALARLKDTLRTQSDPDIRNEILIAILKIDPREVPPPPARPRIAQAPPVVAAGANPTLIRMSIYDKAADKYTLRINLPVAFAQMLVDALGEADKVELKESAKKQGIDLDDIFDAIQKSGTGRFLDVDTPENRIEVWIE